MPGTAPRLYPGDKVIQTKNDYELGVMNGAMGIVVSVDPKAGLAVDFDGRPVEIKSGSDALGNIQLAYATSIHKVQGSEFPCAVVVAHKSHSFMHHRNLLYTAVTRAKESVIILGDRWGIEHCAQKRQVDQRNTFLSFLLAVGGAAVSAATIDVHAYYRQVTDVDIGEIARELLAGRITQESATNPILRLPQPSQPIAPVAARLARQARLVLPRLRRGWRRPATGRVHPARRRHAGPVRKHAGIAPAGTGFPGGPGRVAAAIAARSQPGGTGGSRGRPLPHLAGPGGAHRRCGPLS